MSSIVYSEYTNIKQILIYFLLGGFTIVIALSWNNAITNMINKYFPERKNNVSTQFIYAFTITLSFVLISSFFIDKTTLQKYYNL